MSFPRSASTVRPWLTLLVLVAGPLAAQTPSPLNGTWKLNLAKSSYSPANLAPKSGTTKYTVTATTFAAITDGIDSQGRATHSEYTAKCDGTDAPWKGTRDGQPNTDQDAVSVKCMDAHTFHVVNKSKGKALTTVHIVVAADGKTRTSTVTGTNAQGVTVKATVVYDKQ
jgi:hypothetical protein